MIFILTLMSMAFAQEPEYTVVEKAQPAPFAGYLFTPEALDVLTEAAKVGFSCPAEIDYQVGLMEAKKAEYFALKEADYQFQISNFEAQLLHQQQRIQELEKAKKPFHWTFWTGVGIVIGTGTTIAIANAVN